LPENILLEHFYLGLNKEAALHLDTASGGSFSHKTINEGKAILEKILKTPLTLASLMSFLKKEKKSSPALNQKIRNQFLDKKSKF
jgi:hypothetical protein